jgi:hypothetical protein
VSEPSPKTIIVWIFLLPRWGDGQYLRAGQRHCQRRTSPRKNGGQDQQALFLDASSSSIFARTGDQANAVRPVAAR